MTFFLVLAVSMVAISLASLLRSREALVAAGQPSKHPSTRRATNAILIIGLPIVTIVVYAGLGRLDALDPLQDADRAMAEQRTARLATRLETQTDDIAGWRLLARSYERLKRFDDAARAYATLVALQPRDADALVDLADALSLSQGGSYAGEPIALARRALALDAGHARALAIAANDAAERDDLAAAIAYWEQIRSQVDADSEVGRSLRSRIDEARQTMAAARSGPMEVPPAAAR